MSRPVRIEFPGANYYVSCHASMGQCIFLDNDDRGVFINILDSVVNRFRWVLHGYVLMSDHFHLLVEVPEANLSRGMRQINGVYTQHFNRRYGASGALFKGRFKSILFEKNGYLARLHRHLVLNPLRNGEGSSVSRYRWSSHRPVAGITKAPSFLNTETILSLFAKRPADARRKYQSYVRCGIKEDSPLNERQHQVLLGSDRFIKATLPLFTGAAKPRPVAVARKKSLASLFAKIGGKTKVERNELIHRAYIDHKYTLVDIGDFLGLHYTTVSRVINHK